MTREQSKKKLSPAMGKKNKNKKGKGAEKTAQKTEKKAEKKTKKLVKEQGEVMFLFLKPLEFACFNMLTPSK